MDPKVVDIIKIIIGILGVILSIVLLYFSIIHNYQGKIEEKIEVPKLDDIKGSEGTSGLDTVILDNPDDTFIIDKPEVEENQGSKDDTVCL
ncbi:hypothetical protein KYB31_11450 [Clostridium felsineum]|uniref:hypothetical protein n=1 Tax=Clostridium felsineum TaxID=36839 RepID=UPI00098C70C0|nr:hypothetical protein [Clostridium felsineum]MCR3759598.1 hypothetical protein [Clostridium felsineum]URZ18071.1 hypothetical protein CLFE_041260 [Clostridium felsineum DSM 794]